MPKETLLFNDRSRRDVLATAGGALLGASLGAGAALAAPVPKARGPYPPDIGRKFAPNGQVREFLGNTILCHLPQQGQNAEAFNALLDVYRQLPAFGFARKVTWTPPSSYHTTIFGGANDQDRKPGLWPGFVSLDATMADCNRLVAEHLKGFSLDCELPFRLKVDLSEPEIGVLPMTVRLQPVDEAETAKLRRLRDRLSEALQIRAKGHDSYRFHVTMGYAHHWLTPAEDTQFRAQRARWMKAISVAAPEFRLGAPELCTLSDMFAFHRQFYLG
jgi:hypothetical protein